MKNYKIILEDDLDDINSKGTIYKHTSGAKIVHINNDDNNKSFFIAFKTLPTDNTGLPHIMEHCVLCGSRKYNAKDPFNQLDKGSINTYLNAITFSDKTVYPIASTNSKDYFKLIDVYLDAVFFPKIYNEKGIFMQEGWYLDKEKNINGIVYNEMQGVYSSPVSNLEFFVKENLYNNAYKYDSGGYVKYISNLSYEQFLDFHKNYYTPQNALIYFYGDVDINFYLDYLHNEYLSKIKNTDKSINIFSQLNKFDKVKTISTSYFSADDLSENYVQIAFRIDELEDISLLTTFSLLSNLFTEVEGAKLKEALVNSGICENVYSYIDEDMKMPMFVINCEGVKDNNTDRIKIIVEDTFAKLYESISQKSIDAVISNYEFYIKEADFGYKPKGLFYGLTFIRDYLYTEKNFDILKFDLIINKVKNTDFKDIIKKYFIDNKNCVYAINLATNKQIDNTYIDENIITNSLELEYLKNYQSYEETKEDLISIPLLEIADINKKGEEILTNFTTESNFDVYFTPIKKSDICYIDLNFKLKNKISFEDRQYLTLATYLFGKLNTKRYKYSDLSDEIEFNFGDLSSDINLTNKENNDFEICFTISARLFEKNLEICSHILQQVLFYSELSQKSRIDFLIRELISKLENSYIEDGGIASIMRSKKNISNIYSFNEDINGIQFYKWLKALNLDDICSKLDNIYGKIFNKDNLFVAITCDEKYYIKIIKNIKKIYENLTENNSTYDWNYTKFNHCNEGFIVLSNVAYNSFSCDLTQTNFEYSGITKVVCKLVESDFIWNKIRIEGGAYGGKFSIGRDNLVNFSSYRDPNIDKTYSNFSALSNYLKNIKLDEKDLRKYIIGTINIIDRPLKNSEINGLVSFRKSSGVTNEMLQQERLDILNCKLEKVHEYGYLFESLSKNMNNCCTVSSEEFFKKNQFNFDNISNLMTNIKK